MSADQDFLRSILGDEMQPVDLAIGYEGWQGWQSRLPSLKVYQARLDIGAEQFYLELKRERQDAQAIVEQNWRICHARNIRLFTAFSEVSQCGGLFAVPGLPVPKVAEYAQVGSGDWSGDGTTEMRVNQLLAQLSECCSFEILSAYPSSLEAVFVEPANSQIAEELDRFIWEFASESAAYLSAEDAGVKEVVEDGKTLRLGGLARQILREQRFHLWWD